MEAHEHVAATASHHGDGGSALVVTESAAVAAKSAMRKEGSDGAALRVSVLGGGCSGMQYNLGFDREVRRDDVVVEQHGVRVVVDATSLPYLQGMTLDYVNSLHGGGFKFLNPNATRTCGCGTSFSA